MKKLISILFLFSSIYYASADSNVYKILILSSTQYDLPAINKYVEGFKSEIKIDSSNHHNIYLESLDMGRYQSEETLNLFRTYLIGKYSKLDLDMIVTVWHKAYHFMDKLKKDSFNGVPILATVVHERSILYDTIDSLTFVHESRMDGQKIVEIIANNHRGNKNLYVISGSHELDINALNEFKNSIYLLPENLQLSYLNKKSFSQIKQRVDIKDPNSVALYIHMFEDITGKNFIPLEVLKKIVSSANIPIYGISGTYIGTGIVGGKIEDFTYQGKQAAKTVNEYLNGNKINSITKIDNPISFDNRALQKWDIDYTNLPEGANILFRDIPIWSHYEEYLYAIIAFIVFQSFLVLLLFNSTRKRKKAEELLRGINNNLELIVQTRTEEVEKANRELKSTILSKDRIQSLLIESEKRIRKIFNEMNDAVFINEIDSEGRSGKFLEVNAKATEYLEYSKDELLKMSPVDIDKNLSNLNLEQISKEFRINSGFTFETVHTSKSGKEIPVELNCLIYFEGGKRRELSVARDISDRKIAEQKLKKYSDTQAVLLREVNHRVKNNLSALIAILHKEEDRATEMGVTNYLPLLNDLLRRIESLVTVHDMLSAKEWSELPCSELVNVVVSEVLNGLPSNRNWELHVSDSDILINSTIAHHLTLVLNELTTNSIKYGNTDQLTINVDIQKSNNSLILRYMDNGIGFPKEFLEGDFSKFSIGLEVIYGIVTQSLGGEVVLKNVDGAVTEIKFEMDGTVLT